MKKSLYIFLSLFAGLIMLEACKEDDAPANPYDQINNGQLPKTDTLNPDSYVWLHRNIFAVKCASPGCHDGAFEPDFRSIQSSYATLVYHRVFKKVGNWKYRVVPHDTANSWLWQRVNHELIVSGKDTSQGRMPLYSSKLSNAELLKISNWIMGGAKDLFGQKPSYPNTEPSVIGYIATNSAYQQIDTSRVGGVFYNSFLVDENYSFYVIVVAEDDSTDISQLINNKLRLSLQKDNFSGAPAISGTYVAAGQYKFWQFTVNTALFKVGDVVYMRYSTNDGDHPGDTEFPRPDMLPEWKSLWSFKVASL